MFSNVYHQLKNHEAVILALLTCEAANADLTLTGMRLYLEALRVYRSHFHATGRPAGSLDQPEKPYRRPVSHIICGSGILKRVEYRSRLARGTA